MPRKSGNVKRKRMNEQEYKQIKYLQELNLSPTRAAEAISRSQTLVSYVYKSKSFEEYLAASRERQTKHWDKVGGRNFDRNPEEVAISNEPFSPQVELDIDQIEHKLAEDQVAITQIACGFAVGSQRVIGLGSDNKVYTWKNGAWEEL